MIEKLKAALLILFSLTAFLTHAKDISPLEIADSLFFAKKYTAAFEEYQALQNKGQSSPSMLLKMAFIKEGLGDYTNSLYYLHHYYQATNERAVLTKLAELADKKSLSGYKIEDRHFFLNAINKYTMHIQVAFSASILILTIFMFRSKRKNELPIGLPIIQVLFLLVLLTVANGWLQPKRAIIGENTFLMSAPSAASEPIGNVQKGHLVEIIEETEVWTKIRWNEEEVYIRKAKLKLL